MVLADNGDLIMVMLAISDADCQRLYHYLLIDAFDFKKHVAEYMPEVTFLSAGYRTLDGRLKWKREFIELPKWYDLN
jgi:hypothetical protein